MAIRVLVTGGTFDKEYDELRGVLYFKDTHVSRCSGSTGAGSTSPISTLMMVDSLDMTDEDRAVIVERCRRCEEDRIVLTHGTDTMVGTASAVARGVADRAIVLTGAMVP